MIAVSILAQERAFRHVCERYMRAELSFCVFLLRLSLPWKMKLRPTPLLSLPFTILCLAAQVLLGSPEHKSWLTMTMSMTSSAGAEGKGPRVLRVPPSLSRSCVSTMTLANLQPADDELTTSQQKRPLHRWKWLQPGHHTSIIQDPLTVDSPSAAISCSPLATCKGHTTFGGSMTCQQFPTQLVICSSIGHSMTAEVLYGPSWFTRTRSLHSKNNETILHSSSRTSRKSCNERKIFLEILGENLTKPSKPLIVNSDGSTSLPLISHGPFIDLLHLQLSRWQMSLDRSLKTPGQWAFQLWAPPCTSIPVNRILVIPLNSVATAHQQPPQQQVVGLTGVILFSVSAFSLLFRQYLMVTPRNLVPQVKVHLITMLPLAFLLWAIWLQWLTSMWLECFSNVGIVFAKLFQLACVAGLRHRHTNIPKIHSANQSWRQTNSSLRSMALTLQIKLMVSEVAGLVITIYHKLGILNHVRTFKY